MPVQPSFHMTIEDQEHVCLYLACTPCLGGLLVASAAHPVPVTSWVLQIELNVFLSLGKHVVQAQWWVRANSQTQ